MRLTRTMRWRRALGHEKAAGSTCRSGRVLAESNGGRHAERCHPMPGRPEGFHLQPPTEPCVNLSIYPARPSHFLPPRDDSRRERRVLLPISRLTSTFLEQGHPLCSTPIIGASSLSGRRRRARLLSRWPPSAAQTGRAVIPHPAFTKTLRREGRWKEPFRPS